MRTKPAMAVALSLLLGTSSPGSPDVWDVTTDNDDGNGTNNEILHGTAQVHDLAARPGPVADQDWYVALTPAFSSWEVVVDGVTGDLGPGLNVARVNSLGTVLQNARSTPGAFGKYVSWQNIFPTPALDYILVSNAACGSTCDANAQYTIRAYDTTYSIPRFNNSATQFTILIIQNRVDAFVEIGIHFFDVGGGHLYTTSMPLSPRFTLVMNTATNAFVAGRAGSIVVTHSGRYGDLAGKAVALEPATGFTFDTPMVPRPL